jgi:hypothetical protein
MANYRIYRLNELGRITAPPVEIECDNDQETIEEAQKRAGTKALEIWRGAELVYRFMAKQEDASVDRSVRRRLSTIACVISSMSATGLGWTCQDPGTVRKASWWLSWRGSTWNRKTRD